MTNVLLVDRELYDMLPRYDQGRLLKTAQVTTVFNDAISPTALYLNALALGVK